MADKINPSSDQFDRGWAAAGMTGTVLGVALGAFGIWHGLAAISPSVTAVAADTIRDLQYQGYTAAINGAITAPLERCFGDGNPQS